MIVIFLVATVNLNGTDIVAIRKLEEDRIVLKVHSNQMDQDFHQKNVMGFDIKDRLAQ